MRRLLTVVILAVFTAPASLFAQSTPGPLIVVGGGGTTPAILSKALAVAGGRDARVAVLPQASELPDTGTGSAKMWLDSGAKEARPVVLADRSAARDLIGQATLIWMPGGDQNRFMKAITDAGLDDLIRERHKAGVAVGGTSAGAAVLSDAMITGEADLKSVTTGTTQLARGLGLWPEVIVDQHFLKRQRGNRLISAVLDRPTLVGVGIDERTAVIVRGSTFEVVGASAVVVVDARHATRAPSVHGRPVAATDIRLSVLRDGMTYRLD